MARISNKDKALAYASDKGIILTMEDADAGDELGAGAIEVWSLDAHLSEPNSYCHTYFARGNTEPRAWADALAYMEGLTDCPADCSCRDNGQDNTEDTPDQGTPDQDQDQDRDQDQDQDHDQDNTLTLNNHQDHYQNHSNEAEVWVCECCALWLNGEHSCDYYNQTHPNCDPAIIRLADDGVFTVGYFHTNCNGCGMIQRTGATIYGAIRAIN